MGRFVGGMNRTPNKPSGKVTHSALIRQITRLFRPYRGQVAIIVAAILFSAGIGVVNPILIKVIFDHALFCGTSCPDVPLLYQLVGLMVAIPIVGAIIGIGQTYLINTVGQRVMEDMRNLLYGHLQGMSMRFFTNTRTGEIQSRLTNDIGGVQDVITDTASSILSNVVILLSTIVAMLVMSWQLTVLSLVMVPLFLLLTYRAGNARRLVAGKAQESKAEISAITEETLSVSGILLSKVFGRAVEDLARFKEENRRLANLAIRREMVGRSLFAVVQVFFSIAPALVYLVAGLVLVNHGAPITAGTIVAFTTLQSRLFFPIGQMLQVSVEIQGSLALFERIFEYLAMEQDIVDDPQAQVVDPTTVKGEISFKNVFFRYEHSADPHDLQPSRAWAINDMSFTIAPGTLAAIVGPSGAGKTTVSYLIPRLYDVTDGSVAIDGLDVRKIALHSMSDIVSMVTQETYLFNASVRRNLLYAKPDATDEELIEAAKAAFIHDRIMALAEGYDTVVGERGYRMSGGEKQRLAIARVALKAPRVLILDEATSALDTTSERLVQAALKPLMAGRTTVAIAHRLSTILAADTILVVNKGELVEQGTHAELLARNGLYTELYEQQFHSAEEVSRAQ